MEKIETGKILTHMDRIHGKKKPITADVFLTNFCNNNCEYCTYKRHKNDTGSAYMPYEDFKRYARKLKTMGVKGIILTGGGEPTINPDFDKICDFLERNKYPYGINTNFNELKFIKPEYLKVSLDGWDEESYERIRGVRAYGKTRENIKRYAEWKKKYSPNTALGIQIVGTGIVEINRFYEANKDLDVDYISIRPVESTCGKYYKNLSKDADNDPYLIMLYLNQLRKEDSRVQINYKWNMLGKREKTCIANWAQVAIDEKGNLLYCCHKPNEIVGHILEPNVLEKKRKYKTDKTTCDIPCRMSGPNMEYNKYRNNINPAKFI